MALIKFGGGVLDARGSIGGNVFSRNRYGNYMRARTAPVNPQTQRQSTIRAIMAEVSSRWFNVLTEENRGSWNAFASNHPMTNKLGESINLSGFNHFVRSNVAAKAAGLDYIEAGPVTFIKPGEDTSFDVSISAASQEVSVTFDDTLDWIDETGAAMIIQVGAPQSDSINYFGGPFRAAGAILGDDETAPSTPAAIDSPFVLTEDQKIFVRGRIIRADGRLSDWFRNNAICGA